VSDEPVRFRVIPGAVDAALEDTIEPASIEHRCDEIYDNGRLQQRYNYLDYWFELDGLRLRARVDMDHVKRVAIYPPHARTGGALHTVEAPAFREAILAYLKRRFRVIDEMSLEADGYRTIWRCSKPAAKARKPASS